MALPTFITNLFASQALVTRVEPSFEAKTGQLAPAPLPKQPNRPVALPSFKTQVAKQETAIRRNDRNLANTDVISYRNGISTAGIMRDLAASNPDLSSTLNSYLRVGIPEDYTVIARNMDGSVNREATELAQEVLRRITFLGDVTLGYNPVTDLQSLSESLGKELALYGAMALELALDKQRNPTFVTPVSTTKIQWKEEDSGVYPIQVVGGEEIKLDMATFFYVSVDQDLLDPYSSSMFESSIQAVLADAQFLNDLRGSMQRVIQPRMIAEIIEEKVATSVPDEIKNDQVKLGAYYAALISSVSQALSNLSPTDALVTFDSIKYTMLTGDGRSPIGETLATVQKMLEAKLAAGARSNSAVLGRSENGTAATTSTMLFVKNADVIRRKLNTIYSRMLTVACRLYGEDVFVEFTYADIDLRPQGELEAYKSMKQSRILEQLSLGLITDEVAAIELTGNLPPPGMKPLSGTMFHQAKAPIENPDSQTSTMNGQKDNLKPDTPAAPKGK